MTDATGPESLGVCIVGNVAPETSHGEGGLEIRKGLRHFAPGAKVWIAPPAWGDGGERVIVAGRHRRNHRRYMRIVIERRFLTNFRVRAIYSPALLRALMELEPGEEEVGAGFLWSPEQAESSARSWNTPTMEARVDGLPRWPARFVTDPPPMELHLDGTTYYLSHFNFRGARYSPEPPPAEPSPTLS